ncbi:hypothetical protein Tdes44962_MAKER09329 [Teratosphaeria destructans]|uniref:Uncharacterized protein n=1 Tax=Teratosphaeria destructans TaxID=418781 RepID=A0A9W7W303_9PEZI|nr:hypothetical protein Tdes44962_MAKER09329 [Teratosphaeria destructans]
MSLSPLPVTDSQEEERQLTEKVSLLPDLARPSLRKRKASDDFALSSSKRRGRSLTQALRDIPDCSTDAQCSVEAWIATDQPGYSSIMPTSSRSSRKKQHHSKASGSSHTPSQRASTQATSADSDTASSIKTIHDPRVRNILADNGIRYTSAKSDRAQNYDDIMKRLALPRGSMSPSQGYPLEEEFDDFVVAHDAAPNEDTLLSTAFLPYFHRGLPPCGMNSSFSALATLTEEPLPAPKPSIYFGEAYTSLDPEARKACERKVVPYTRTPYLLVNQTAELRGIAGKSDVARTQAMYNGAAGARAIDSVRSFSNPEKSILDSDAQTHGATFSSGCLSVYETHSKPSERGFERDYVTQQIAGEMATASPAQFRRAVELYRNQCDLAREDREEVVRAANARCRTTPSLPPQTRPRGRPQVSIGNSSLEDERDRWFKHTMARLKATGLSTAEAQEWVRKRSRVNDADDDDDEGEKVYKE